MATKTKTFKIGEYCKGGIITVNIKGFAGNIVQVIGKQWDMSQGTRRSSDQTNAKEFTRIEVVATDNSAYRNLDNFLNDLTTSYYAGQVMEWIESKVKLGRYASW